MLFTRLIPSCLLVLTLAACGGGGDSDNAAPSQPSNSAPQPSTSTIQGNVVKGVVINGLVSAYSLENGAVGALVASTTTNQYGQFQIQLTDYQGPLYIEVTPNGSDTTMKCDSASGCGDYIGISESDTNSNGIIDFGETFPVPSDFNLTGAIANAADSSATSVTTLTHLATQLALSFPQGLNDISLEVAQSQIENLFAINEMESTSNIDLTDPSAVSAASEDQLEYSLLSSALIGLSNDVAFVQVLDDLANQFVMNNGQLVTHDSGNSIPSLLDIVEESLATAQLLELNDQAAALLQTQAQVLATPIGTLTEAAPSPTAGGSSAEIIEAFLADLHTWQGYLSLSHDQTSFANVVSAVGISTGSDLAQMLKAISVAGQFGPVVALPDAALGAVCDSLGNYFYQLSCRLLISGRSLQEICEGSLNLVIFGRSLCDFLNDLTLPLGNGLTGHFALYDGVARIYGTAEEVDVDITFTSPRNSNSTYGFSVEGTAESDTGSLEISEGSFQLVFEGGLDIRNLKLPEQASGEISVSYAQTYSMEVPEPTAFDGTLSVELDLSGVRETEEEDTTVYAGLDNISIVMMAEGEFESFYGERFEGSIALNGGADSNVVVEFETDLPDYSDRALITLTSTPERLVNGEISKLEMSWGGKQYEVLYFYDSYTGARVSNQDGVFMDLELGLEDEATAGYLILNGTNYGTAYPLNGSLMIELSNGMEWLF